MKKIFLIVSCLSVFATSQAQSDDDKTEKPEKDSFQPSAAVKWNPSSLYFGKIGLQGEYNFKKKRSLTFAVGIPMSKTTTVKMDDEDRDVEMKTFSLMGGYRMYLGKKNMTGLYFEPYLKYVKNDAATLISTDLDGEPVDFATTSQYSGFGLGAQLGVQFMIAKKITLDFFFLGPEANTVKHSVLMKDISSTLPWDPNQAADAEKEINESIGDLPIIGNKLKVAVDANKKTVSSEYKGFLPGVRFGLSVGVRF